MIVKQILLVSTLLIIWCLENTLILEFKDVVFMTRNVCGRRRLAFFFARARHRNFSLRSWRKEKKTATYRDLTIIIWTSLGVLSHGAIYFEGFIRKYPFDFFVDSWFYQQLGVKELTLNLLTGGFRRKTTHLLLDEGGAWPSMGIYSDSRSSWKYIENDR